MAAAAVPIGASLLAPEVASVAAPTLAGTLLEGSAPWLTGAALGGLGGLITGQNPLKSALLGGIGGGITSNFMPNGFGGLFDGGTTSAPGALNAITNGSQSLAPSALPSLGGQSLASSILPSLNSKTATDTASSGLFGNVGKFLPYAGLGLGASLLDNMNKPKTLGPPMQSHPSNPGPVSPLSRTEQSVDPNSYFSPSTSAARNYYAPYPMQPQFMAKGGSVRRYADGGSSSASSSNIPMRRMTGPHASSFGGKLINSAIQHPSMYPIKGRNMGTFRYYADGGAADSGMINGDGDGQSDSIPAKLSDGEFVMSAPAVSALGNGSNNAGAKKLSGMQKNILRKHYKSGKPHKAMGLSNYVH